MRAEQPALASNGGFDVVAAPVDSRAFVYMRTPTGGHASTHPRTTADSSSAFGSAATRDDAADRNGATGRPLLIAMNPGRGIETVELPSELRPDASMLLALGSPTVSGSTLTLPAQAFAILG